MFSLKRDDMYYENDLSWIRKSYIPKDIDVIKRLYDIVWVALTQYRHELTPVQCVEIMLNLYELNLFLSSDLIMLWSGDFQNINIYNFSQTHISDQRTDGFSGCVFKVEKTALSICINSGWLRVWGEKIN